MDLAAAMAYPHARAATAAEYALGRIQGLPPTYEPQFRDKEAPQYLAA